MGGVTFKIGFGNSYRHVNNDLNGIRHESVQSTHRLVQWVRHLLRWIRNSQSLSQSLQSIQSQLPVSRRIYIRWEWSDQPSLEEGLQLLRRDHFDQKGKTPKDKCLCFFLQQLQVILIQSLNDLGTKELPKFSWNTEDNINQYIKCMYIISHWVHYSIVSEHCLEMWT